MAYFLLLESVTAGYLVKKQFQRQLYNN